MQYKRFNEKIITFSIIMIPLLTLLFGLRESPFNYTLSMIGNWFGHFNIFIIWGIVTAILLIITISNIFNKFNFKNKKATIFLLLSGIFLILTVLTPMLPQEIVTQELRRWFIFNFHFLFAVIFSLFLVLSLYLFSKYLSSVNKKLSLRSFRWLLITVGGSIFTLFIFGKTGIFQLFFFICLSIFLLILHFTKNIDN
jgi:hypothetical protein